MTNASSNNVRHSDTALLTELQKKRHYNTDDERVFLIQQAADAKTAIQHTMADMQVAAKEAANVSWWTQQYPWYAVGAATVLGFLAATSVLAPADHRPRTAARAGDRPHRAHAADTVPFNSLGYQFWAVARHPVEVI